nr:MAG TPA: N-6 DNA Methylase [Caudoviricetes sp.]DAS35247.1 MAG TPA: N-6 DNA Methylase [Caudoviricetes sp.]
MELSDLKSKVLEIFEVVEVKDLGSALMKNLDNYEKMRAFEEVVNGDLSKDWLQKIYQYHEADRKEKKQDYTPASLGKLLAKLSGNGDTVIDLCAGSGALTIQKWNENHNQRFLLYELDENVIPYLLYNLAIRNIGSTVVRADTLKSEAYESWEVRKGERYGKCIAIKSTL